MLIGHLSVALATWQLSEHPIRQPAEKLSHNMLYFRRLLSVSGRTQAVAALPLLLHLKSPHDHVGDQGEEEEH